jgi:hypothetical protein
MQINHTIQFIMTYLVFQCVLANVHNKCDIEIQINVNFSILNKNY